MCNVARGNNSADGVCSYNIVFSVCCYGCWKEMTESSLFLYRIFLYREDGFFDERQGPLFLFFF